MILLLLRLMTVALGLYSLVVAFQALRTNNGKLGLPLTISLAFGGIVAVNLMLSYSLEPSTQKLLEVAMYLPGVAFLSAFLGAAVIASRHVTTVPRRAPEMSWHRAVFAVVGVCAALLCINWILFPTVGVKAYPVSSGAVVLLVTVLTTFAYSLAEEVFFRGWVQSLFISRVRSDAAGRCLAVVGAATLFAAQHVSAEYPGAILFSSLLAGTLFGLLKLTFGLGAAIGAHFVTNLVLIVVLPRLQ
jgi:membrane protease YdiL (CAAX protease family)